MDRSVTILELLKKDESDAFRLLFERYYDNLLLYFYHLLGDFRAAEDIVQECFVNLWNLAVSTVANTNNFTIDYSQKVILKALEDEIEWLKEKVQIFKDVNFTNSSVGLTHNSFTSYYNDPESTKILKDNIELLKTENKFLKEKLSYYEKE